MMVRHYGFADEELDFIPSTMLRAGINYDITHLPPEQLAESILAKEQRIAEIVTKIKGMLGATP